MSRLIRVPYCASCPHIRVGYNHEKTTVDERFWDYCQISRGQTILDDNIIADFCPLEKSMEKTRNQGCMGVVQSE